MSEFTKLSLLSSGDELILSITDSAGGLLLDDEDVVVGTSIASTSLTVDAVRSARASSTFANESRASLACSVDITVFPMRFSCICWKFSSVAFGAMFLICVAIVFRKSPSDDMKVFIVSVELTEISDPAVSDSFVVRAPPAALVASPWLFSEASDVSVRSVSFWEVEAVDVSLFL